MHRRYLVAIEFGDKSSELDRFIVTEVVARGRRQMKLKCQKIAEKYIDLPFTFVKTTLLGVM